MDPLANPVFRAEGISSEALRATQSRKRTLKDSSWDDELEELNELNDALMKSYITEHGQHPYRYGIISVNFKGDAKAQDRDRAREEECKLAPNIVIDHSPVFAVLDLGSPNPFSSPYKITTSPDFVPGITMADDQADYPEMEVDESMGSPVPEQIKDWSYVYKKPNIQPHCESSMYAPLTSLPSHKLPPIRQTENMRYKPSRQASNMPGYQLEIFDVKVEDKYLCSSCRLALREPFQTYCGHRYCKSCLDGIFRLPGVQMCKQCPPDTQSEDSLLKSDQMFPDRAIKRDIGELPVKCGNSFACEWKGKAQQYDAHQETCEFGLISCPKQGCGKQVMRMDLAAHMEKECAVRQIKCKYCAQEILLKDEKDHLFICPQFPMNCDFCGKKNIPRAGMQQHQDENTGDCKRLKVTRTVGKAVSRPSMVTKMPDNCSGLQDAQHQYWQLKDYINGLIAVASQGGAGPDSEQVKMLEKGMKALYDRIVAVSQQGVGSGAGSSEVTKMLENRLQQMASKQEEMRNKYVAMESRVATFEGIVAVLNREIEKCSATIEAYERQRRQDREIIESLQRKIKSQERIIALKDVALAEQDLRITSLEMTSYDATLLWKIQDFTRKRHDAITGKTTSIYSPCFYTSRTGYKMCARIYLNGDGMGKGTHVSLFFVLMRGHFDGLLRWPFRQKVTFMLLDQNNREHVIDAFRPDPTSSSFKRPTSDMNIASGCPLFMPLSQLESTRHAYVRDDAIFLKIIVDTSDSN
ncbi:TRAF2 [Branchiostoma lanceolatum]|uniref:TRAF2 protein n=1 Tax=Branchiostoma lanceolatum TaxID=7740 RepID=A0A8K0A8K3_BRALA|nr:TRAF2 [Branchiostoma lanceolatum]